MKLAIVSSKICRGGYDDFYLLRALRRKGVDVQIKEWNDSEVEWDRFSALLVKSVWGYYLQMHSFLTWLDMVSEKSKIINSVNSIKKNIYKNEQMIELKNYDIPIIESIFISRDMHCKGTSLPLNSLNATIKEHFNGINEYFVVKPIVSAAADMTFKVRIDDISMEHENIFFTMLNDKDRKGVIIQPYVESDEHSEISLIYIGKKLSHIVKRCSLFSKCKTGVTEVDILDLPNNVYRLGEEICKVIVEQQNTCFLRIDIVLIKDKPFVMEVEVLEPNLFFNVIKNDKKRICLIERFADEVMLHI